MAGPLPSGIPARKTWVLSGGGSSAGVEDGGGVMVGVEIEAKLVGEWGGEVEGEFWRDEEENRVGNGKGKIKAMKEKIRRKKTSIIHAPLED